MDKKKEHTKEEEEHTPEEEVDKQTIKKENTLLTYLFTFIGIVILIIVLFVIFSNPEPISYKGVPFEKTNVGNITFYRTVVPLYQGSTKVADYNFFLRTHPEELENIPFEGDTKLYDQIVINQTEQFSCGGHEVIAFANLVKLYDVLGVDVVVNNTIGCSPEEPYSFLEIRSGANTSVVNTGGSCYTAYVNNCEILQATEKIMAETFVRIQEEGLKIQLRS